MIRTAQDVIDAARARGFEVKLKAGPPPMPYLVGKQSNATPALMEALRAFRPEILELLTPEALAIEVTGTEPAPMEDSELPDDIHESVSLLFRAGDGTIQSKPFTQEQP